MEMHLAESIEERRQAWTLYVQDELNGTLPGLLQVDYIHYSIYHDSGYNQEFISRFHIKGQISANDKSHLLEPYQRGL